MQNWENLREDLKESNREQAAHIIEKLHKIGLKVRRSTEKHIIPLVLSDDQVDLLAEMEHMRWISERLGKGWKYGSSKDPEKRISPYIVPWSELAENVKDLDRNAVKQIPELLKKAGFEVT